MIQDIQTHPSHIFTHDDCGIPHVGETTETFLVFPGPCVSRTDLGSKTRIFETLEMARQCSWTRTAVLHNGHAGLLP